MKTTTRMPLSFCLLAFFLYCSSSLLAQHPCDVEGGAGCDDANCETFVCTIDPFCCDVEWDGLCVQEALDFCGNLCSNNGKKVTLCHADNICNPQTICVNAHSLEDHLSHGDSIGPCENFVFFVGDHPCDAEGTAGCSDCHCQETVCAIDPYCCETEWDGICVGEALEFCTDDEEEEVFRAIQPGGNPAITGAGNNIQSRDAIGDGKYQINAPGLSQPLTEMPFGTRTYPNPAADHSTIEIKWPIDTWGRLMVFNATGQRIEVLYSGMLHAGVEYSFDFDASKVPAGVYYYKLDLQTGRDVQGKLVIQK